MLFRSGIYSSVGITNYSIDHNSIALSSLSTSGTVSQPFASCVTLNSSLITLTSFRNNILVNTVGSTSAYAIYTAATTNISGGTVNNNDYYVTTGNLGYYNNANVSNLNAWKTATGKDLNGISVNPPFISSTDLHLNISNASVIPFNGTGAVEIGRAHV